MHTFEDTIFEETSDGGAVIGYLTLSPSGYPRPNVVKYSQKQYKEYKKMKKEGYNWDGERWIK